jgi:hypothetical protein
LLLVGLVAPVVPTAQAADGSASTLQLSSNTLSQGQTVTVSGLRWTPNTVIQASLCGDDAAGGSVDCAVASSVTLTSGTAGVIDGRLAVVVPPKPCPCVVLVVGAQSGYLKTLPVTIVGAPVADVSSAKPTTSKLTVVDARLLGSNPFSQWFGMSSRRTLSLTLRNEGAAPASSIQVIASLGSRPLLSAQLSDLGIGREKTYELPLTIPALSVGSLNVDGRVFTDDGQQAAFKVPLSIWPIGLLILAILLLQVVLLAARNILRRRHEGQRSKDDLAPPTSQVPVEQPNSTEPVSAAR